jgi:hypothetical protein
MGSIFAINLRQQCAASEGPAEALEAWLLEEVHLRLIEKRRQAHWWVSA